MLQSRLIRCGMNLKSKRLGVNNWAVAKRYLSKESSAVSPAVHSSHPTQGQDTEEALKTNSVDRPPRTTSDEPDPLLTPISSSPKLGHTEVGRSSEPNKQQRRVLSNYSRQPNDAEAQKAQKKAQEEDNKEYFKHHKASPLSEVELADTRKPVTQATDSPTSYYGKDPGIILWKPEQLDSAEDSLLRAVEIWKWNKMRGDPDSPHGRVLRELRGEYW